MPKRDQVEGIEDWKADYYRPPEKGDTDYDCATKTRLKYSGAEASVLEEYNLAHLPKNCSIAGMDGGFDFDTTTCAFCFKYLGNRQPSIANCKKCPVARESVQCNNKHSPWRSLSVAMDPAPMIEVMDRILEKCTGPRQSYEAR